MFLEGTLLGDVAVYNCSIGYNLASGAERERTCTTEGEWSGEDPRCESKSLDEGGRDRGREGGEREGGRDEGGREGGRDSCLLAYSKCLWVIWWL